ncbi:hypothetical protein D3C71_2249400 [compost metagenome]
MDPIIPGTVDMCYTQVTLHADLNGWKTKSTNGKHLWRDQDNLPQQTLILRLTVR